MLGEFHSIPSSCSLQHLLRLGQFALGLVLMKVMARVLLAVIFKKGIDTWAINQRGDSGMKSQTSEVAKHTWHRDAINHEKSIRVVAHQADDKLKVAPVWQGHCSKGGCHLENIIRSNQNVQKI